MMLLLSKIAITVRLDAANLDDDSIEKIGDEAAHYIEVSAEMLRAHLVARFPAIESSLKIETDA